MQLAVAITLVAAVLLAAAATSEATITYGYGQEQHAAGQDLTGGSDAGGYYDLKAVVGERFNLSDGGSRGYAASYAAFLADFDFHVNKTADRWIRHHPVLRDPPATLFNITVTAEPNARVSFFLRSDNLYLAGFANKDGGLFSFMGDLYRLPGSRPLSFGSGYPDFFGTRNGYHGLLGLLINREQAVAHLRTLSNYQAAAPDQGLKVPIAFFVLTLCEAERFAPIREAVIQRWASKTARSIDVVLDHRTNTLLLDLVVKWSVFSWALLSWSSHGESADAWRRSPDAGQIARFRVATAQDALSTVNPILQPTMCY